MPHRMISLLWRSSSGSRRAPGAVRHRDAGADRRAAQGAHEPGRAEVVEEPGVEAHHRQQALVAGAAVGQHRLGAVGVDRRRCRSCGDRRRARRPTSIGSNSPEPFGPVRRSGVSMRSGLYTRSRKRLTFGHSSPWLYGWSALPRSLTATPSVTGSNTVPVEEENGLGRYREVRGGDTHVSAGGGEVSLVPSSMGTSRGGSPDVRRAHLRRPLPP